ncbi:GNAT family protein [Methyloligella sp. 2.7D]|uniref:GNAT family N-acetyltransferase n=1 Tax=unclassified Methyloligella TaxID=2625955 RepID=UPI00157DEADF|nr:GNAT family protein [Methyloligella sp. GL2]QKP77198.1 GNAT family N-acetyltransferase [Methyloligella sp. GL2]
MTKSTKEPPVLRDGALILRPARESDAEARLALGRTPEIARMFPLDADRAREPLTLEEARRWAERLMAHPHGWAVEYEGRLLGEAHLSQLDRAHGSARFACAIYDPAMLGKGLGRRLIRLVLAYGFGELGLHRIGLRVLAYNERAIRCYKACGFVEEGLVREAVLVDGERHDDILMGVLRGEFEAACGKL